MKIGEYRCKTDRNGQTVFRFSEKELFILRKGVFRNAGYFCWEDKIQELGKAGIGLNRIIARKKLEDLLIFDKKANQFYHISDLERAEKYKGSKDIQGSCSVLVYPFSCFDNVVPKDVHNIERSPVDIEIPDKVQTKFSSSNNGEEMIV